ncbi:hypothetical protein BIW11_01224 [Tropilaelaps mercedesae]|uniref:Uncharacterized protein n=1 Tax=Tropilaelaps mercedesae TaxID=418985 RepID=A0A1V9XH76_9ACAR|nr:hypothetical protein BIW11_01224 [Tropilaelaps mercedesae]
MDPFTPSTPILLIPSWGTAIPVMTISLLAADFYNISLWMTRRGENCIDAHQNGSLSPVKWNWQWIESSYWHQWHYSYPGTYCIMLAPFSCQHCPTTLSGPFVVERDTSEGGACCFENKVLLHLSGVHRHRFEPDYKKSVSVRIHLDKQRSGLKTVRCGTRFYVEFFNATNGNCSHEMLIEEVEKLAADELILEKDFRLHDVAVNLTNICAKLIPRCDRCAFICPPSYHHLNLTNSEADWLLYPAAYESTDAIGSQRLWLWYVALWFVATILTARVIIVVNRQRVKLSISVTRPANRSTRTRNFPYPVTPTSKHSVVYMGHIE